MKTVLSRLSVLIIAFLFFNCSSDSAPQPPPIVVKTKVKITEIQVNAIPQTNGALLWDTFSDPDVYIKLHDETSSVGLRASNTLWDFIPTIANSFILNFTSPIQATDLNNTSLTVQVYDDDSDDTLGGSDDKIGEVSFDMYQYTIGSNKYPSFDVKTINGTIVTINMVWE